MILPPLTEEEREQQAQPRTEIGKVNAFIALSKKSSLSQKEQEEIMQLAQTILPAISERAKELLKSDPDSPLIAQYRSILSKIKDVLKAETKAPAQQTLTQKSNPDQVRQDIMSLVKQLTQEKDATKKEDLQRAIKAKKAELDELTGAE